FRVREVDEAGTLTATYIHSIGKKGSPSRVDAIDSIQAFVSSIAGLLSSRAVLLSVGVGDSSASPTSALLLSMLQQSLSRIAKVAFAYRLGKAIEPECKMYRFCADLLHDSSFVLNCLSPMLPKAFRPPILALSSICFAVCDVVASSTKASLSAHFAKWENLGELNAKDSSQETIISLLGMLTGSLLVNWISGHWATWTALILMLSVHLEANRRAVRAIVMQTLNRQRATVVYHRLCVGHIPRPAEVSRVERIFERNGAVRDAENRLIGVCTM
ncbi:uncharacterized protein MYCFIDRAFT_100197, partial [Pseudocercospora fijiensis CIRAD86]